MRFSKVFFRRLQSFIGKMGKDSRMNMVIESWLLREPLWYFEALWKLGCIYIACKHMMCLKTSSQAATCDIRIHAIASLPCSSAISSIQVNDVYKNMLKLCMLKILLGGLRLFTFQLMEDIEVVNQFVDLFTSITSGEHSSGSPTSGTDPLDIGGVTNITREFDL